MSLCYVFVRPYNYVWFSQYILIIVVFSAHP